LRGRGYREHQKEETVRKDVALVTGVAIGAGTMFLLDSDRGRRRRALIRDKAARPANISPDTRTLRESVHAELGRVVSHPHAIEVMILHDGCVSLGGPILSNEADATLAAIAGVRGVATVEDNLERHDSPEGVPALQGARLRMGRRMRQNWSPTRTLMVALAGTAVAAGVTYAMRGSSTAAEAAA